MRNQLLVQLIGMKTNITQLFILVVVLYSWEVECGKVIKSGIVQLSLNAKRESNLWTAVGNNGTEGIKRIISCE